MSQKSVRPGSRNAASTVCPNCGKEFWYYLSWPRKYCSNACKGKANVQNIKHWAPTGYAAVCETCGKTFWADKAVRGRFCSRTCHGKWLSAHIKGGAHPNTGRKFGRPSYLPAPTMKACPVCGKEFVVKPSHAAWRRFCSKQCMAMDYALRTRGEDNFNWQGGYEPYYGPSWRAAQRAVRERDKVCRLCGMTPEQNGRELDVHHIKPFRTFRVARHLEANDLSNLMALCHACHMKYERAANRTVRRSATL